MNKRRLFLMAWILATSVSTAYADNFVNNMIGEPYLQPMDPSSHRSVTGTVTKIRSEMVFLRTDQGTIRAVGLKALQRDGMPSIKPGDQVDLIVDRGNSVLAIAPPRGTGAYIGNEVSGTVQRFDILNKQIAIKTKDGDTQNIELRQAVATKLNGVGKGSAVSLEMDGHDHAFDAYKVD
jgi:hypothetical protein